MSKYRPEEHRSEMEVHNLMVSTLDSRERLLEAARLVAGLSNYQDTAQQHTTMLNNAINRLLHAASEYQKQQAIIPF